MKKSTVDKKIDMCAYSQEKMRIKSKKKLSNNYTLRKRQRYDTFKQCFQKLASMLPYDDGKSNGKKLTNKVILLDSVAYIKSLEIELGMTSESDIDWCKHYQNLMEITNDMVDV